MELFLPSAFFCEKCFQNFGNERICVMLHQRQFRHKSLFEQLEIRASDIASNICKRNSDYIEAWLKQYDEAMQELITLEAMQELITLSEDGNEQNLTK